MNIFKKIKLTCTWGIFLMCIGAVSFTSCREEIDTSDLYTFTGETISSYLEKDSTYSAYCGLLKNVTQSTMTQSTVSSLLSARGNYTCFAPTNAAINAYLDTMMNVKNKIATKDITEFLDSVKNGVYVYDSIAKAIVYNSIIDCGTETAYETAVFPNDGTFPLPNMNDRFLTAKTSTVSGQKMKYIINNTSTVTSADNEVENGYVHQVDCVIAPTDASVFDLLKDRKDMKFFSLLLQSTGWNDSLTKYLDEEYENIYPNLGDAPKAPTQPAANNFIPEHRKYGFTIFAETDDVYNSILSGYQGTELERLCAYLKENYGNDDTFKNLTWGTSLEDVKDPMNAINQFVSYHLLPISLSPSQIVIHYNEKDFDLQAAIQSLTQPTVPVFEYYETMTGKGAQRRLMKVTESKISNGIRINRYMKCDNGTYQEDPTLTDGPIEGIRIVTESGSEATGNETQALNGYIYPIEDILVYNKDVTNKVLNERIRFDVASFMPELINLGYRRPLSTYSGGKKNVYFPKEFSLQNMEFSSETDVFYFAGFNEGWGDYQGDEFNISGNYDITVKLPPVPSNGTYEIRFGIQANQARGMAQVYFGEKTGNTIPQPEGIPLDLRGNMEQYGWEEENDDPEYNADVNKKMRNQNHMKGPRYFVSGQDANKYAYNVARIGRRIIVRKNMEANKTYYLRFKNVMESTETEFYFDYIEFCPSIVYNNPKESEDEW